MIRSSPAGRLLCRHPRYFKHLVWRKLQFFARYRWIRRFGATDRRRPRPLVYKLMLNWRCNLRCPVCMLWGDTGWVKEQTGHENAELAWETVQKVFDSGLPSNASFILSGGEPTMYSRFGRLLTLLRERRTFAIICTNGLWLDRYLNEIDGNPFSTFLISLDGPQDVNDSLRGKGVWRRVVANIEALQALERPPFVGIQYTIVPENVHLMERFCEEMVRRGVDWILLNPSWAVSEDQAAAYRAFMHDRFGVEATTERGYVNGAHFDCDAFEDQLRRIRARTWPISIASHIKQPEWVHDFIDHPAKILGNRLCYKQWLRLDVLPNGKVPPCVQFPDYTVGDLSKESVEQVWQGVRNRQFQKLISEENLPVCAKCDNLYLYDGSVS